MSAPSPALIEQVGQHMIACIRIGFHVPPNVKVALIFQHNDQRDLAEIYSEISSESLHEIASDALRTDATQQRITDEAIAKAKETSRGGHR